jgi:hypothetical protein
VSGLPWKADGRRSGASRRAVLSRAKCVVRAAQHDRYLFMTRSRYLRELRGSYLGAILGLTISVSLYSVPSI